MLKLHIANTFFEWELETQPHCSLLEAFHQHAIFRQLQFLPLLYAAPQEAVLLPDQPEPGYLHSLPWEKPQIFTLSDPSFAPYAEIESWGPSRLIASFAKKHKLAYPMPNWELVRQVNSKQFSFECSPKLPHAALLHDERQARQWLGSFEGKKVLKTCYGVSGKGHLIIEDSSFPAERIDAFLKVEWKKGLPVIAEPWVARVLDFSTQWHIDRDGRVSYVGSTICNNDERGQYRFNTVGDEQLLFGAHLPFLKEHLNIVTPILAKIAQMGFFGNVGIDAMVYNSVDSLLLHPVVEINARKTMGWAALAFQRKHFPDRTLRFSYSITNKGYLPQVVVSKTGKIFPFSRNLTIEQIA